jgi:hypothetical protein
VRVLAPDRDPGWIVLQCEAVTDIDATAAEILRELDEEHFYASLDQALADIDAG